MDDSNVDTHIAVVVVGSEESRALCVEDIRGRIHREYGTLVAWVPREGSVSYELVEE